MPTKSPKHTSRPAPPRAAYSIPELAAMLGCHRTTLWRKIRAGQLNTVHVLGRAMIPAAELKRLKLIDEM